MKLKSLALFGAIVAAVTIGARVAQAFLGGVVVNSNYAVSQIVPIPLGSGVTGLSAVVAYSSPSFSATTFTTGQVSTGSITIADNTKLTTAAATESIVVLSTSGTPSDFLSMSCPIPPGAVVVRVNNDWRYGATVNATATNLAAALTAGGACLGGVHFVASGNVVYSTAPIGSLYNNIHVVTNNPSTLTVSSPTFLGGRNSTVVSVNGSPFQANLHYSVGVSSAASATNLASAINARTPLNKWITATAGIGASVGTVALQSKLAGSLYNFRLTTSNSAAASVFGPALYGGLTPSWALGGTKINAPSHGFVTGLAVLYGVGSGAPAIAGLTNQTTYYVGVVDANDLALATTNARAAASLFITLASSSSLTAAKTYTLAPLAFATGVGTGFSWSVSNDASTWLPLQTSSVTYVSGGTAVWDFGQLDFRYLGLNVTAPTSGAMSIKVTAQGQ